MLTCRALKELTLLYQLLGIKSLEMFQLNTHISHVGLAMRR